MNNAKILIVEDNKTIAQPLKTLLTQKGYWVIGIAPTGEDAVDIAHSMLPDLILMNIQLRGQLDGITACEQIKKIADIPILFLSGYADPDTFSCAMQQNPSGYL